MYLELRELGQFDLLSLAKDTREIASSVSF